jgi:hypothetical protein
LSGPKLGGPQLFGKEFKVFVSLSFDQANGYMREWARDEQEVKSAFVL